MSLEFYEHEVSEPKLRELLTRRFEAEHLDFKETVDPASKKAKVELCKDVIAMANTMGGHIVLGVRDGDFAPVGLPSTAYLDQAELDNLLGNYVHEKIDWLLAYHNVPIENEQRLFGILYVVPSSIPLVTAKTGAYQQGNKSKMAFSEAALLVRSGSRSMPARQEELRALLHDRQRPGASLSPTTQTWPSDSEPPVFHNLPRPNFVNFIGRQAEIRKVKEALEHERAWVVSIEGIGGVGKTALAQRVGLDLVNDAFRSGESQWKCIVWVSAKESVLDSHARIEEVEPGFRTLDQLIDVVLEVSGFEEQGLDREDRLREVKAILETFPCLLVVDNLETVVDQRIEQFLLDHLPAPSKAIITSRRRTAQRGGFTVPLKGMNEEQGVQLLQEAATHQGSSVIESASRSRLTEIVRLTGGIPLALKLVVGQTALGSNLDVVIERLVRNQDAPILEFCFEEVYRDLAPGSKRILGALAQFEGPATLEEAAMVAGVPYARAIRCIEPLVRLSLVEETFDDLRDAQIYSLLPLTRNFADGQAKKLASFYEEARRRLSLYLIRKDQLLGGSLDEEMLEAAKAKTDLERIAVQLAENAEEEYLNGRYESALDKLQQAEMLAPRLAYVQQKWAYIERRQSHIQPAREHYRRAIELDPKNKEYYRFWASFESQIGRYAEAARIFRDTLLLDTDDIRARHGLANALWRQARQLKRQEKEVYKAKELLCEALEVIEGAFESEPKETRGNFMFWEVKARILRELRRPRQALDACDMGLKAAYDERLSNLASDLRTELEERYHRR